MNEDCADSQHSPSCSDISHRPGSVARLMYPLLTLNFPCRTVWDLTHELLAFVGTSPHLDGELSEDRGHLRVSSGSNSECPGLPKGPSRCVPGCPPLPATCPKPETLASRRSLLVTLSNAPLHNPGLESRPPTSSRHEQSGRMSWEAFPSPRALPSSAPCGPGTSLFSLHCDLQE